MRVNVDSVAIPSMSSIGYGRGLDEQGNEVEFTGDQRAMQVIGEAIEAGEDVWAEVPSYAITQIVARHGAPNLFGLN